MPPKFNLEWSASSIVYILFLGLILVFRSSSSYPFQSFVPNHGTKGFFTSIRAKVVAGQILCLENVKQANKHVLIAALTYNLNNIYSGSIVLIFPIKLADAKLYVCLH